MALVADDDLLTWAADFDLENLHGKNRDSARSDHLLSSKTYY